VTAIKSRVVAMASRRALRSVVPARRMASTNT
jgi:hypothetical protein